MDVFFGTTTSVSATPITSPKIIAGTVTISGATAGAGDGTPVVVTVTFDSGFTSATSYACTIADRDYGAFGTNLSTIESRTATTITIRSAVNGLADYVCVGN